MSNRKRLIVLLGVIVLIGAWYAFRPERLFVNQRVNEAFPAGAAAMERTSGSIEPSVLVSGQFHGVAHEGKGTAAVYQLAGGRRVLRFSDFETSNGPEVQVYLIAAADANDSASVKQAEFVSLGAIKGNIGNQNYDLPANVDLQKYRAVTIWCHRFGVNFATAPLAAVSPASAVGMAGSNAPVVLASGQFHGVAHGGKGTARIYQLTSGERVLRFTDFETSNGPDVQVYLVAAPDASDSATVKRAGYLSLGAIKGNIGDQNYTLPTDLDLQKYRAVTIWCRRFGVNFATAPLAGQ